MRTATIALAFAAALAAACVNPGTPNQFPANPPPNPSGEPPNEAVGPEAAGAPMNKIEPERPHVASDPGPTVYGNAPSDPPPPPIVTDALPIDPGKPLPERSVGTDASLAGVDQPSRVLVDGRADIASAGMLHADAHPGGVLPTRVSLVGAAGGGSIRVRDVRGKTGHGDVLVGVFMSDKPHKPSSVVAGDDTGQRPDAITAPRLGETFLIGVGLAHTGTGDLQTFRIPDGATQLYLGYSSRAYGGQTGGMSAIVTQHGK